MSSFEIPVCLLIAVLCYAWRRTLSGWKNAAFYAKGRKIEHERLKKYVNNLHFIETPAWYAQAGQFFPLIYLICRLQEFPFLWSVGIALIFTLASSGIAGPFYQCPINIQEGKPCINNEENPRSEFAWGPISFYWPRPWLGIRRVVGLFFWSIIALALLTLFWLELIQKICCPMQ